MAPTTIIFGPTGNIGSVAARTAAEQGADVVLAMRDTAKNIPGLSKADEEAGKFKRVQADLTDPKTVENAVKGTGATRAFVYLTWGSQDHMKSTFEAMKAGGIDFVVFLSSYTIAERALDDIPQSEVIPFVHAQAEKSLHAVYGADNFVAIRPGGFATNILRYQKGIAEGKVPIYGEQFKMDCITPGDMGRVSGTILVSGLKNGQRHVYLYGPQVLPQREALIRIAKALGKDVEIQSLSEEDGRKMFAEQGMPKPLLEYFVRAIKASDQEEHSLKKYDEGVENVRLYTGKSSTGFDRWLEENISLFKA